MVETGGLPEQLERQRVLADGWLAMAKLWDDQKKFNRAVNDLDVQVRSTEDLAQIYVLGLHSELDELLRRLNWKYHRRQEKPPVDLVDVGDDLADLTKYVMCLWQLFGFTLEGAVEATQKKTDALWDVLGTEFSQPEPGQPVLIVDLDNTVAKYVDGMDYWMAQHGLKALEGHSGMGMAERYGLEREVYDVLKLQWEQGKSGGGYGRLEPYTHWIDAVQMARKNGAYVVVCTARPAEEAKQVWYDCWAWCRVHLGGVDRLYFGSQERIGLATRFQQEGRRVVALEDNPDLLHGYRWTGAFTIAHTQRYNTGADLSAGACWGHEPGEGLWRDIQRHLWTVIEV